MVRDRGRDCGPFFDPGVSCKPPATIGTQSLSAQFTAACRRLLNHLCSITHQSARALSRQDQQILFALSLCTSQANYICERANAGRRQNNRETQFRIPLARARRSDVRALIDLCRGTFVSTSARRRERTPSDGHSLHTNATLVGSLVRRVRLLQAGHRRGASSSSPTPAAIILDVSEPRTRL